MRILLISRNYAPEPIGIGKINSDFIDGLVREGCICDVISSNPWYPEPIKEFNVNCQQNLKIYRLRNLIDARSAVAFLIMEHINFMFRAIWTVLRCVASNNYDIIVVNYPTVFSWIPAIIGKLFSHFINKRTLLHVHVQDLEVDAFFATGEQGRMYFLIKKLERWLAKKFDIVSTISNSMAAKLSDDWCRKDIQIFRNWADDCMFDLQRITDRRRDRIVVGYSGNIGKKQGIEDIIYLAQALQRTRPEVKFQIFGAGNMKGEIEQLVKSLNLINVKIKPLLEIEEYYNFVREIDYFVLPQKKGFESLVFPSKAANLVAAGCPILLGASAGSELAELLGGLDFVQVYEPGDLLSMQVAFEQLIDCDTVDFKCKGFTPNNDVIQDLKKSVTIQRYMCFWSKKINAAR